jgi:zinc transport system substrate-binding protein
MGITITRHMKKHIKGILFALVVLLVASCATSPSQPQPQDEPEPGPKIKVITTIFPTYDWVRQIVGEEHMHRFDVSFLTDSGVDLHSFTPTVSDIAAIKTGDVFIYLGGHSEGWVNDVLRSAPPSLATVNLIAVLEGQVLEGEEYACDPDCDDDHDHGQPHTDEHVWISLKRAQRMCQAIAEVLMQADPDNAQAYQYNLEAYQARLSALDDAYQAVADTAVHKTLVVADRFPFRYMMLDYGLRHYAAFAGCSAETEASFAVIISLANKIDQLGLGAVVVTESANGQLANAVINNTADKNQRVLVMDALQSVTTADIQNGATYLSIMESNLNVLADALN